MCYKPLLKSILRFKTFPKSLITPYFTLFLPARNFAGFPLIISSKIKIFTKNAQVGAKLRPPIYLEKFHLEKKLEGAKTCALLCLVVQNEVPFIGADFRLEFVSWLLVI
ncbi:MAG: hypothetical protein A2Y10_14065 [Planctomycetes bacterium GWF2_41_51]|nr:MAG: hypothetical protein A2Y10_14065 [Planctomycetes bacterium GWF2_41_51]